jgi:hypothetical protein
VTFEPKLQIRVAPLGDDSSPGTAGLPFGTLRRAQEAVRAGYHGLLAEVDVKQQKGDRA